MRRKREREERDKGRWRRWRWTPFGGRQERKAKREMEDGRGGV
jgi:hypothetical protein